jgi:hypothetical protein
MRTATVLEENTTENHHYLVRFFLWTKYLNAMDIPKEMFHVYGGKFLSRKGVQIWVIKRFADDERFETEDAEVVETTVKRLLYCRFRRTDKAMEQI